MLSIYLILFFLSIHTVIMNRIWSLRIHLTSITTPLNFSLHKVYIKSLIQKLNSDEIVQIFVDLFYIL